MKATIILTSKLAAESGGLLGLAGLLAKEGSRVGLLFTGDGVYSLVQGSKSQGTLEHLDPSVQLYGCLEDIQARGITQKVAATVKTVDYGQVVELMMNDFSKVVSYL